MALEIAANLLVKPLAFSVTALPMVIDNLRTGRVTNTNNAILLLCGLGVLALGPSLGMSQFHLPAPSLWMLVALVPFAMFALKWVGGGAAKFLIALLPWFSPGEYLFVVIAGFLLVGAAGMVLRHKEVQIATPMVVLGLVVMAVRVAAVRHP